MNDSALIGNKYGKWTVLGVASPSPGKRSIPRLECKCDCGTVRVANKFNIIGGRSFSCGCSRVERIKDRCTTHGHATDGYTSEYWIWSAMKARCFNPKNKSYHNYGGRGITVCDRWLDFENFISDMGLRPSVKHSIDRIENDKGYAPGNCRWATDLVQARNSRHARKFTFEGIKYSSMSELAECKGLSYTTLRARLRYGWPLEQAVNTPIGHRR